MTARSWTAFAVILAAFVADAASLNPGHAVDPEAEAVIDTAIVAGVICSALLAVGLNESRRTADLLLFLGVTILAATEFAFVVLPFLTGASRVATRTAGQLACEAGAAVALAAAAFTPSTRRTQISGATAAWWALAAFVVLSAFRLVDLAIHGSPRVDTVPEPGLAEAVHHPAAMTVVVLTVGLLVVAAVKFVLRGRGRGVETALLAATAALLAGASVQHLAVEMVYVNWLTPADGLRLGAAGCLLAVAIRRDAARRRGAALAAITAERERIARDLHDGLVQDLAYIASQGQLLAPELGDEHPITIAARRALDSSRQAIADLAPAIGPTMGAALRNVARELERRFEVPIEVLIDSSLAQADAEDEVLDAAARYELARIAREAILNAIRHGGASHVLVRLFARRGELLLRVCDDGSGLAGSDPSPAGGTGIGLQAMSARAELLGGRLVARPGVDGGTVVELVIS